MQYTRHIPNLLTLCNLSCGAIGIIIAFNDHLFYNQDKTIIVSAQSQLFYAGILVLVAAGFDFLDGLAARLLNAKSKIGADLDSLADVISFGLLPCIIAYRLLSLAQHSDTLSFETNIIAALPALLIVIFAALRLAIFNNDATQNVHFIGLPSPANGIFWAGCGIASFFNGFYKTALQNTWVLLFCIIISAILMVSRYTFFSFKTLNINTKTGKLVLLFLVISLLLILFFQWIALPLIVITYLLFSIFLTFIL